MKHRDSVDGVHIEMDDGNPSTAGITELHGKLAEKADDDMVAGWIKGLEARGYVVVKQ